MRKFIMLGTLVALVVVALALPALAQDRNGSNNRDDRLEAREDYFDSFVGYYEDIYGETFEDYAEDNFENGFFFGQDDFEDEGFSGRDDFEERFYFDEERFDEEDFDGNGFDNGVSQSFEQEADSGDVDQSFNVTGGGDNSNQCVGIQGTANTGNAQNQIGVIQYGSDADEFDFEDVGSSVDVSPTNTTSCDQQVNQAASAFGGR